MLSKVKNNPKQIFLIDAIGALVTTIGLVLILVLFEAYFGMPRKALYLLCGIAFSLFLYSSCCYFLVKKSWKPFLLIIITGNIIYALVSVALMITHYDKLTELGLIYFTLEKIIIAIVVHIEHQAYVVIAQNEHNEG